MDSSYFAVDRLIATSLQVIKKHSFTMLLTLVHITALIFVSVVAMAYGPAYISTLVSKGVIVSATGSAWLIQLIVASFILIVYTLLLATQRVWSMITERQFSMSFKKYFFSSIKLLVVMGIIFLLSGILQTIISLIAFPCASIFPQFHPFLITWVPLFGRILITPYLVTKSLLVPFLITIENKGPIAAFDTSWKVVNTYKINKIFVLLSLIAGSNELLLKFGYLHSSSLLSLISYFFILIMAGVAYKRYASDKSSQASDSNVMSQ